MEGDVTTVEEDATAFKLEVLKVAGCVWPTRIETENGGSKHVPTLKRVEVAQSGDQFKVTGTFYDDHIASVVLERNAVMASVPAAARNAIQTIKISRR